MDESERCESLPPAELKNFKKYLENLRTRVAGQGSVKEIASPTSHIHPSIGQPFTSSEEFPPPPQSWIGNRSPTGTGSNEESMHNLNNTLNNNANLPVMDNRNYGANNMIKDFGGLALDKVTICHHFVIISILICNSLKVRNSFMQTLKAFFLKIII